MNLQFRYSCHFLDMRIHTCHFARRYRLVYVQNYPYAIKSDIQGKAHKVLQSDSTQTIDHIQKCFRQKFSVREGCHTRPHGEK